MEEITYGKLQEYLDEIITCDAFELHRVERGGERQDFYIPYMMNDALECYLILRDGRMTGEYLADFDGEMTADLVETEQGSAVIFHQGPENVFTIWFKDCFRALDCYRYDQIGHFWVQGEEHWRRLVYIVGTIHDKYNYMGECVCNGKEMDLMLLMEFAPFRYFSPIHDSLDEYYSDSMEGVKSMETLAEEADDRFFLILTKLYRYLPFGGRIRKTVVRFLTDAMMRLGRNRLYQLIFEKVKEASMEYPERRYPEPMLKEIQDSRETICRQMKERGFSGSYPLFEKERIQILAMEEHPFTILESEQYKFKVQYMVSETGERKNGKEERMLNAGFFKKKGNRGWIARDLDFLNGV